MKMTTALLASAALITASPLHASEEFPLKPLTEAPASSEETFFKIKDNEAQVGGELIQVFVVKPEHLTVSYRNKSEKGLFPKYVVRLYNRYGILLGGAEVSPGFFGGSAKLEPGDVGGEKIGLTLSDVEMIFQHTALELPDDFEAAAWLSVSESNSRLTTAKE